MFEVIPGKIVFMPRANIFGTVEVAFKSENIAKKYALNLEFRKVEFVPHVYGSRHFKN